MSKRPASEMAAISGAAVGGSMPEATLWERTIDADGDECAGKTVQLKTTGELLSKGKVVLFGIIGAFSPG